MGSDFERWEKDPFFSAAEEVQESADRMASTYRTWIHSSKEPSKMWNSEQLQRDLHTALGTTKWQLEEFERAVGSTYEDSSADDARDRHCQFIGAIGNQVSTIESSLQESAASEGRSSIPWVRLDEGERDELALFLTGPALSQDKTTVKIMGMDNETVNPKEVDEESVPECPKNSCYLTEWGSLESREEKLTGHRRTASANADIGAWKIAVADDGVQQSLFNGQPYVPPRKVPSVSGLLCTMDCSSKLKWPKNGFRKLKVMDRHQEGDSAFLRPQISRGISTCYEKGKSCLDGCDDCYDKQLYGWYGAMQRQLQRSQYQMQYGRPIQVTFWIALLCLIVLIALYAM